MGQTDSTELPADHAATQRWEDAHPGWTVISYLPVITTAPDGKQCEEIEVQVLNLLTGTRIDGFGSTLVMALAQADLRIGERC